MFSSTIAMKVYLATAAVAFALVQVLSAAWVYGKLGVEPPPWAGEVHRISGRLAFLISLPVAYHCLWSLGFTFAVLVGAWYASGFWFITDGGFPPL